MECLPAAKKNIAIYREMDAVGDNYIKWTKPVSEWQVSFALWYVVPRFHIEMQNNVHIHYTNVKAKLGRKGEVGSEDVRDKKVRCMRRSRSKYDM